MGIFGARPPDESTLHTFRAPASAPRPDPARRSFEELLAAATEADQAAHALARLKASYLDDPSPPALDRLMRAATRALEKEEAFDGLWKSVSKAWFDQARRDAS